MEWLDKKYIDLISPRLEGFRWKSGQIAFCRCPFCGDSQTNKRKKRGYFYSKHNAFQFFCHNGCGGMKVETFLKRLDYRLFQEYRLENFAGQKKLPDLITKTNLEVKYSDDVYTSALKELKKISQLPVNHPAKQYVDNRKIPPKYHSILRYCPNFMQWTNQLRPGKFEDSALRHDQGRIVIPFFDSKNRFFAYTGRAVVEVDQGIRYILIVLDHDIPLIYGMDQLDLSKTIYATEGPIDSIFLPNAIAFQGNFLALTSLNKYNIVLVFDNEPRSKDAKKKFLHAIDLGYKVCIWPSWVEYKDINKMIMEGWTSEYIKEVIDSSTYSGLEAKVRLEKWMLI